jgi:hypothetical protein
LSAKCSLRRCYLVRHMLIESMYVFASGVVVVVVYTVSLDGRRCSSSRSRYEFEGKTVYRGEVCLLLLCSLIPAARVDVHGYLFAVFKFPSGAAARASGVGYEFKDRQTVWQVKSYFH